MIEFYNPLPYEVEFEGVRYKLTPSFDNVLNMMAQTEGLNEWEKLDIMLYYLVDGEHPRSFGLLKAIMDTLMPPDKNKGSGSRCFDYIQDAPYIYSAFMQAYGIDLFEEQGRMHWWKFRALMQGLPEGTKLAEIIQIRLKPMPKADKFNAEERAQLLRLKREFALEISDEERQSNLQRGLAGLARMLEERAKGK